MKMYGNWRSAAAFRVRIALNLKGIPYEEVFLDLDSGDQLKPDYLAINPQGAVPALFDGDGPPLTQSLAILDYLEDVCPAVPLLPAEPRARARARSLAQVVACDTHPLYVPRVRNHLMAAYGIPKDRMMGFVRHWFETGLKTLETRLSTEAGTGAYCQGDAISHADLCLASLWVGTAIFEVETRALSHGEAHRRAMPEPGGLRQGASPAPARRARVMARLSSFLSSGAVELCRLNQCFCAIICR